MLDLKTQLEGTKAFTVSIGDLKVQSRREFKVQGKTIAVSDTAFKDLLQLVGLSNKTVNHINEELAPGTGYALVKELMRAMSTKRGTNITLLIDEENKQVSRICLEGDLQGGKAISPAAIEELIMYTMDKSDKVKLANTFVSDGGTKVTFNLKWDSPISLPLKGEDIALGKQVVWDLIGPTTIADFVERQICTNGMTAIVPSRKAQFLDSESDPSEWYKLLYKDIMNPNKSIITHYQDKVYEAVNTNLSVYEYNKIKSHVMSNWNRDADKITRFLGNDDWRFEYEKVGIDLTNASAGQLRNCPTPVNAWDAVNCLTDLSSHKYNSDVTDRVCRDTQRMAGQLLNKTWDENQQIFNTPTFKNSGPLSKL
jgi:hypothetical protein